EIPIGASPAFDSQSARRCGGIPRGGVAVAGLLCCRGGGRAAPHGRSERRRSFPLPGAPLRLSVGRALLESVLLLQPGGKSRLGEEAWRHTSGGGRCGR